MREPLVAGEEPTPLQRALVLADSGNGVSSASTGAASPSSNVDLSVHLERLPGGEWVCLDAVTLPGRAGSEPPTRCCSTRGPDRPGAADAAGQRALSSATRARPRAEIARVIVAAAITAQAAAKMNAPS